MQPMQPMSSGAPVAPPPPAAKKKSKTPMIIGAAAIVAVLAIVAVVLATRASDDTSTPKVADTKKSSGKDKHTEMTLRSTPRSTIPDDGSIVVQNDDGSSTTELVKAALTDILGYWKTEMPAVFSGEEFAPISGGFWASGPDVPLPPCAKVADDIAGNAFYCSKEDNVAWDSSKLIPDTEKNYGPLAVGVVFAHEIGHSLQARVGMSAATVTLEQQADCYAGAWVNHLQDSPNPTFGVDSTTVDHALAGFLELRDQPGTSASDPSAHGSAFDRLNSFQDGFESGASKCAAYTDQSVADTLTEIQFSNRDEAASGGNMAYAKIVDTTAADLNDYWAKVFPQVYNATWTPLNPIQRFGGSTPAPACGADDTSSYALFYCVAGDYVALDDVDTFPAIADQIGDFAVSTLIASQYGLAVETRLQAAPADPKQQNLLADCLSGSWAASVFNGDRPDSSSLSLSPGDLDETAQALLAFSSTESSNDSAQGTGFERVQAFRKGILGGVKECVAPR